MRALGAFAVPELLWGAAVLVGVGVLEGVGEAVVVDPVVELLEVEVEVEEEAEEEEEVAEEEEDEAEEEEDGVGEDEELEVALVLDTVLDEEAVLTVGVALPDAPVIEKRAE
jgi:hypothetical protein